MSIGDELETGNEVLEVRRVRWRYVKGGLRMVIHRCAGTRLVSDCAVCEDAASVDADAIACSTKVKVFGYFPLDVVHCIEFDLYFNVP